MKMSFGKLNLLLAFVWLFLMTCSAFKCVHQEREHLRSLHKRSSPEIVEEDISSADIMTPGLPFDDEVDDDFEKARLEYIKQQILHKLGMSKAPSVQRKPIDYWECKLKVPFLM